MSKDMTRNWENGLVALGAYKERLRIRRAQREALKYLERLPSFLALWGKGADARALDRFAKTLDAATRAPRGKGKR